MNLIVMFPIGCKIVNRSMHGSKSMSISMIWVWSSGCLRSSMGLKGLLGIRISIVLSWSIWLRSLLLAILIEKSDDLFCKHLSNLFPINQPIN